MNKIVNISAQHNSLLGHEFLPRKEKDSGSAYGGRSFYFFDFDDNIMRLNTEVYLFHKTKKYEVAVSSIELSNNIEQIGITGMYQDFEFNYDDKIGSFRNFRDRHHFYFSKKLFGHRESFVKDIKEVLNKSDSLWKAPSWSYFYYACLNQRPVSIITARGHSEETIKNGINVLFQNKLIPKTPNYLSIFCVSNPKIRKKFLGKETSTYSVSELKKMAIRQSVEKAIKKYGRNEHHRFGMSDDDPQNIKLITEEMMSLKRKYQEMKFFVIQTYEDHCIKREIFSSHVEEGPEEKQLTLF